MAIRIIRLGTPRLPGEGLRLGTVRRPPRGVPKGQLATRDFYDVWLPVLAPTPELVKLALGAVDPKDWERFVRRYRREMSATTPRALLDTLAALSQQAEFSVGCYCANEARCHRSVLRQLFAERGARLV